MQEQRKNIVTDLAVFRDSKNKNASTTDSGFDSTLVESMVEDAMNKHLLSVISELDYYKKQLVYKDRMKGYINKVKEDGISFVIFSEKGECELSLSKDFFDIVELYEGAYFYLNIEKYVPLGETKEAEKMFFTKTEDESENIDEVLDELGF